MNNAVILMTATVAPNGTKYTYLQDPETRKLQYLEAIDFYLRETAYDIVFCENTGANLFDEIESPEKYGRLEYLTFYGNDYDTNLGKGYGEARIIEYAIRNSHRLKSADFVIKITGRVKILNIDKLSRKISKNRESKRPYVILELDGKKLAKSVCLYAPKVWLFNTVGKYGALLCDIGYSFERMIYHAITETADMKVVQFYPYIDGICGGFNNPYVNFPMPIRKLCYFNGLYHLYHCRGDIPNYVLAKICWVFYAVIRKIYSRFRSCDNPVNVSDKV